MILRTRTGGLVLPGVLLASATALAAEEGHAEPNLFAGGLANAFVTLIIFVVVVTVLTKVAWNPILKILHERERMIRDSLESAKNEREQAEQLLAQYQQQLDNARTEAAALVEKGRQDAEAARQRILNEARQETTDMTARAKREIELTTDAAIKELYDQTADLAIMVAGRVLEKELSAEDHRKLISDSIAEIREQGKARLN